MTSYIELNYPDFSLPNTALSSYFGPRTNKFTLCKPDFINSDAFKIANPEFTSFFLWLSLLSFHSDQPRKKMLKGSGRKKIVSRKKSRVVYYLLSRRLTYRLFNWNCYFHLVRKLLKAELALFASVTTKAEFEMKGSRFHSFVCMLLCRLRFRDTDMNKKSWQSIQNVAWCKICV